MNMYYFQRSYHEFFVFSEKKKQFNSLNPNFTKYIGLANCAQEQTVKM